MRRLAVVSTIVAAGLVAPSPAAAQTVTAADVTPHLEALDRIARENGGNRAAGLPGEAATVRYIAEQLRAGGWQVTEQPVTFPFSLERREPIVGRLRPVRDVAALQFSGSGDVRGRVQAIRGNACRARSYRRFRRGRIALIGFGACTFRRVVKLSRRAGARAVLFDDFDPGRDALAGTLGGPGIRIPVLAIDSRAVRRLGGRRRPIRVRVDAISERRTAHNVVAELPGGNGRRVLMAGGHLDSVVEGPGLNDNGSGVAALLEVAERVAADPRRRDTVRLGFWTAEEWGAVGSAAYVRRLPRAERRRVRGYINLDMVGSPNAVPEIYTGGGRTLERALRRHFRRAGRVDAGEASDHVPFADAGIPVGGLFTGATEWKSRRQARRWGGRANVPRDPCYHRACDGLSNVDRALTARLATVTARAVLDLVRPSR